MPDEEGKEPPRLHAYTERGMHTSMENKKPVILSARESTETSFPPNLRARPEMYLCIHQEEAWLFRASKWIGTSTVPMSQLSNPHLTCLPPQPKDLGQMTWSLSPERFLRRPSHQQLPTFRAQTEAGTSACLKHLGQQVNSGKTLKNHTRKRLPMQEDQIPSHGTDFISATLVIAPAGPHPLVCPITSRSHTAPGWSI